MKKVQWTKELLEKIVPDCYSYADVLKKVGLKTTGSNPKTLQKKLYEFNVDFSHFRGQGWQVYGHPSFGKSGIPLLAMLCEHSSFSSAHVKERLFNNHIKENKCEICGLSEWLSKPIMCELHHINGDTTDNRIENLQILCPNCHSQTDNFRSRNRKSKKAMSAQKEISEVEAG